MWDVAKCNFCGDCFVQCRYVDYDREKAISEIKLLAAGKEADILKHCITCVACTEYCPTGADPSDLVFKMQEKTGTAPLVMNNMPVRESLAKGLEGQGDPVEFIPGDPDKPVLSLDSFEYKNFPEGTLGSRLFQGMTVVRGPQYMSLTGCVHMGGQSFVEKYAARVIGKLAELNKDIVYIHNEGYTLAHVKARELGIDVPFKYQHLFEYLLDYLKKNQRDITKLDKKVAVQVNCATRWLPGQDAWLDDIFRLIGVERPPRRYERRNALCCSGPVIGINREMAVDMQEKNVQDALDCGAEAMITICPICDAVMRRPTSRLGLPKLFITDLCRIALGEMAWPDK
ncbi:MAG: (Fe-S)-binding protein [Deltaproteobacteria bacterium]|nr:(Fe-S)-binding protein [Deltaproteobacteria bacterium]